MGSTLIETDFSGYTTRSGRWSSAQVATLIPSTVLAVGTASTNAAELGDRGTVRTNVNVSAVTGTSPTLDVIMQTSEDGATNWVDLGSISEMTAAGSQRKIFPACDRFVRAQYTVGGVAPVSSVTEGGTYDQFSPVAWTGTGPNGSNVALSASSDLGPHSLVMTISTGGALGTAALTFTIDGATFGSPVSIPSNGVTVLAGTGLTATFQPGTYVLGDIYSTSSFPTPAVTLAGTPTPGGPLAGTHTAVLRITTGGVQGTAAFTLTIDAGTPSSPTTIPSGAAVDLGSTGLTAAFNAAQFDDGTVGGHIANTFTFTTTAAATVTAELDIEAV